jgi:hypothetical protein
MSIASDREIELLRDGFKNVASKIRASNGPEQVAVRNDMMAELLQELLNYRLSSTVDSVLKLAKNWNEVNKKQATL